MKSKPPPVRRKFAHAWDEIDYLHFRLLYWLYERADPAKARPYADRLQRILRKADPNHQVLLGAECRSLVCETKGDIRGAIEYREHEIRLIRKLWIISRGTPSEEFALQDYGPADLSDRLNLLALLYRENGELDKAIATLLESKQLCEEHGTRFDGEDILEECLEEKSPVEIGSGPNGASASREREVARSRAGPQKRR